VGPLHELDERVEDERDDRGDKEHEQDPARCRGQGIEREDRQGEQDELDPARDDDGGDARGHRARLLGGGRGSCGASLVMLRSMEDALPSVTLLFCGDVVGAAGRRALLGSLDSLRADHAPDFLVVNGENAAGGLGITPKIARELFTAGVDVITLGNHTYRHQEVWAYLDEEERILRPANFLRSQPGHGTCVVERGGVRLGVVNLQGNLFLDSGRTAFSEADAALHELSNRADHVLVDMHAEATSEKVGLGWHLDGRVTAVVGTHTHVPTADARILPGGTAYITDVGMTGARGGVIGVKREQAVRQMLTRMPVRFETSEEDPWVQAVVIRTPRGKRRRAESIAAVHLPAGRP